MNIDKIRHYMPTSVINFLTIIRNRLLILYTNMKYCFRNETIAKLHNYHDIPIVINNFYRLGYLLKLIKSLECRGYFNIYIIDNNSTYPPLLDYYKTCPYTIYRLNKNIGFKAIWETGIYEQFKHDYYVYTDSDMEIDDSCPNDFMEHFVNILNRYKTAQKVGFGIRIDDLPDSYVNKDKVIQWESQYWNNEVECNLFRANIDTTFALYRPYCKGESNPNQKVFRTGSPYLIRHLPWYDLAEFKNEEEFYLSAINRLTHWSVVNGIKR